VEASFGAVADYDGAPQVRLALQILAHAFAGPGELRLAKSSEFDLAGGLWTIAGARTKVRRPPPGPAGCASRAAVARSVSKLLYSDGNLRSSRIGEVPRLQLGRVEA
jgi:hypothetical protein